MANVGTLSVNVVAITNQFTAGMATVRQQLQVTAIASKGISGNMSSMVGALGALGPAAAGATAVALSIAAVKNAVSDTIQVFSEFESSMSRVKAISQATDAEFSQLWQQSKQLGSQTEFTASQVAQAQGEVAQAGYNVSRVIAAMPGLLSLASAGELELAEAARIATGVMAGFHIEARQMSGVADLLAKASIDSKTNVQQLGESLEYVGPLAHAAGLDIFETVAAIELLAEANIVADMAGTGLRGVLIHMAHQSDQAAGELDRLGISLKDAGGNFKPLSDVIDEFNSKLGNLGAADRLESLSKIFDTRGAATFSAMMGQGTEKLRAFEQGLRNAGNTADAVAKEKLDNLRGESVKLKSAIEGLKISIGEGGLGREFRSLVTATSDAVKTMNALVDSISFVNGETSKSEGLFGRFIKTGQAGVLSVSKLMAQSMGDTSWVGEIDGALKEVLHGAEKAIRDTKTKIDELPKPTLGSDGAALGGLGGIEDLASRAKQITEAMRTPVEAFEATIAELNELVSSGQLTWENYGRAVTDALEEVNRLTDAKTRLDKPVSVGAVTKGTTAGVSAERQAIAALNQLKSAEGRAASQRSQIANILAQIRAQLAQQQAAGGPAITINNVNL